MGRRAPEVALERVVVYGLLQHARRIFGVGLAVRFEGFGEGVGGVVGLVEVFGLDGCGVLEGEAGFFACEKEGVRLAGWGLEVGGWEWEWVGVYLAFASGKHSRLACRDLLHFRTFRYGRRRD